MISIIIPCYNGEKYVCRLFDCLNQQTSKNFEVIFVDDGSRDNSVYIAQQKLSECEFQCKIISVENGGVSRARNIGVNNAVGDYIMFVDVDDLITKDRVEYIERIFVTTGVDIVLTEHRVIEDYDSCGLDKLPKINDNPDEYNIYSKDEILDIFLSERIKVNACGGGFSRKLIVENNLQFVEGIKYCEDIHFMWQLFLSCEKVSVSNKITYFYMYVSNSAMSKFDKDRLLGYDAIKELSSFVEKQAPNFYSYFKRWVPQRIMWSYMRQGSCHMSYNSWKQFFIDYPIRSMMLSLLTYGQIRVVIVSLAYLIHPYLFYTICKIEGHRKIHK